MRKVRSALALLQGHMADWLHSPRTVLSFLVILALTYMNARSYTFFLERNALYAHFGETIFYYLSNGFGNITIVSTLFLVMMSEIPRRTAYQNVMLMRCSRLQWLASQVLFCLIVTLLMMGLMLLLSMLMTLAHLTPGGGWSDLERIALNPPSAVDGAASHCAADIALACDVVYMMHEGQLHIEQPLCA